MRTLLILSMLSALSAMGCGQSVVGRSCDTAHPCPTNFDCTMAHDGTGRCMRECDLALNETVCSDGTLCLPLGSSAMGGVCYLGGTVAVGQSCMSDLDCTRTALCLHNPLTSATECRVGCNLDGTHGCSGGLLCQPTSGMTAGFCATTM